MNEESTLHEQNILDSLSTLSYRNGDLKNYLQEITLYISQLLPIDWSVVTLCQNGLEQVLASNIEFEGMEQLVLLHGTVTNKVFETGQTLAVEDVRQTSEFGAVPDGYLCYLGVPLRTSQGETIGTICSFNRQPRQFSETEIRTAELFAERAATAIDNYHLYQIQRQFNQQLEEKVTLRTAELEAAQTHLLEQERLAGIGEFAAIIVHEIRNSLTTMSMGLNYAKQQLPNKPAQERLVLSLSEAQRLDRLLSEILMYAKPQTLQLEELELNSWMQEILSLITELPKTQRQQINFTPSLKPIKILGDRDKLKQVMINIFCNACEASPIGAVVDCKLETFASAFVCIRVENQGETIPPEVMLKLGQPFFSTKPEGTGLGLAIVNRIVKAHRGRLRFQSNGTGTRVDVELPQSDKYPSF